MRVQGWHIVAVVALTGIAIYLYTKTKAKGTVTVDENTVTMTLTPGDKVEGPKGNYVAPGSRDPNGALGDDFVTVPGARAGTVGYAYA